MAMSEEFDATLGQLASRETLDETESDLGHDLENPAGERGDSIDRYLVLGKLGAGAMGVVYAAYDPQLDRKIALKLIAPQRENPSARARLQREAQALAKLDHRNVVAVHDVGEHQGQSFVAMEFVEGQTLGHWMRESTRPRPWPEVVRVFAEAGSGLAAAHEAGLVHRDFKPDNVMLGSDGRVRVMDFGLARADTDRDEHVEPATNANTPSLHETLTQTGVMLGTPAYMAPEQFEGKPADAHSDQFGFCVALHEALYGVRPFTGRSVPELVAAVISGSVVPEPRDVSLPSWLRKVVLRGLARAPGDRWPSMQALLDALADDPAVRRRKWWTATAVAGLLGFGIWAALATTRQEEPCADMADKLAGTWDDARRGEVEEALLGTSLSRAADTWERVAAHLDTYADAWVAERVGACMASHTGEQSGELLDRRMACLDERLAHLRATVDELARGDAAMVDKAVQAVLSLPTLDRCADAEALMAAIPPPEDPTVREQVAAQEQTMVVARAKYATGNLDEALALAQTVRDEADKLGHEPLRARAWLLLGTLQAMTGDYATAEQTLIRAYDSALSQRMIDEAAEASSWLVFVIGYDLGRHADGRRWALHADPLSRAVGRNQARSSYFESMSALAEMEGDYAQAREHLLSALELTEAVYGPDHLHLAKLLNNLGVVADLQGQREQARAYYERALTIREREQGPDHPFVGNSLVNLAVVAHGEGKLDEARELYEKGLAIQEAALGPDHPYVADAIENLGALELEDGRYDEARARFERALAIIEAAQGAEHPEAANSIDHLGMVARGQGKLEEARRYHERALAIRERSQGIEHPELVLCLQSLGEVLQELGEVEQGRAYLERAERILAATSPAEAR